MALNTGARSLGELEITPRISDKAVCCSNGSSRSRVRWSSCFWRTAVDAAADDALRVFGLIAPWRRPFTCPRPPRRCMSPPGGHDNALSYANPRIGAMAGVHFASILAGLFGTLALGPIRLGFIL